MSSDLLRALSISGGILLVVVIGIIIVSIVAVNRGAAEMAALHDAEVAESPAVKAATPAGAAVAAKPAKAAGPETEEISVIQILIFGTGLFVLTVVLLLGVSLIQHMG
jgi:hypothetical protein